MTKELGKFTNILISIVFINHEVPVFKLLTVYMHFSKALQGSKSAINVSPVSIESTLLLLLLTLNFQFILNFHFASTWNTETQNNNEQDGNLFIEHVDLNQQFIHEGYTISRKHQN